MRVRLSPTALSTIALLTTLGLWPSVYAQDAAKGGGQEVVLG